MIYHKTGKLEQVPPSDRRLAAAERHLAKERESLALFADQVAAEQPTPYERIEGFDNRFAQWWQGFRNTRAKQWRDVRRRLAALSAENRASVDRLWRRRTYPLDPLYLGDLIGGVESARLDPVKQEAEYERLRKLGEEMRAKKIDWLAVLRRPANVESEAAPCPAT